MSRSLRPRKSRPSYAVLSGLDEDGDEQTPGAGPSRRVVDDESSESEFEPAAKNDDDEPGADEEASSGNDDDADGDVEDPEDSVIAVDPIPAKPTRPAAKARRQSKTVNPTYTAPSTSMKSVGSVGMSRVSRRQMYALPTPSVKHRHRAVPLFSHTGRVERLTKPPVIFGPSSITGCNNFTVSKKVVDRASRTWGFNVGAGPVWDMLEDRSWFKEGLFQSTGSYLSESARRPVVHKDLRVKEYITLTLRCAQAYLPRDVGQEEDSVKPPAPVQCYFGPFGSQTKVETKMFDATPISQFIPNSTSHVFNAGAPVWGIDWCPIHAGERPTRSYTQYLAVAPFPSKSHSPDFGVKTPRPSPACIQIWSLAPSEDCPTNAGKMKCEMVLCIKSGPAHELKWCPLPSHDSETDKPRKLGVLTGIFEDGSVSIYVVPEPQDVRQEGHDPDEPVFVELSEPSIRIELEEAAITSMDWANSDCLAVGTSQGVIAVFKLGNAFKACNGPEHICPIDLFPTHYITVHQSAIRALSWIRAPAASASGELTLDDDPTVIASGGYDGVECFTDIREGHGSAMNRTRDVILTMAYAPYGAGIMTIDHDNIIKLYSVSPSMLGRGHLLVEPQGPVWSVSASDYHPQMAVASADGTCLTTNMLRGTRKGGSVPFFYHKIFQVDYSRKTGEYRMLERFLPQELQDRPTVGKQKSGKKPEDGPDHTRTGTGAWPPEVGVHKVAWNSGNGLGRAGMLASATASGLCRVDLLWGRWMKDKIPYSNVEQIRMEDGAMDVESEESGEN
ncbi:WD40-repeat-containing domain protein [Schizophyllum amplum]|uniref:WD40-repeat-containing domain protein n=1 Tax=Schizophyllum amplum TaxID=97359 RepID=A0A550BSU1_9AGAR|nr:WD40-repeat-containing domain protein [Auriculariopsis ampla]